MKVEEEYIKTENQEFMVVAIPSIYSLIIDGGENQGISLGDRFNIVGEGVAIKHPVTKKVIGYLESSKGVVKVTEVYSDMCVCKSVQTAPSTLTTSLVSVASVFGGQEKALNVDENQIGLENASIESSPIEITDKAIHLKRVGSFDNRVQAAGGMKY